MAKIAICYATDSGVLRWVAGSDQGDIDPTKFQAQPGEAILVCDHADVVDERGFFQESLASQQVAAVIK